MERHTYMTRRIPRFFKLIGWILLGIGGAALLALLFGYVVMLLWNWLLPALFGVPVINFWQAVGIVILARLIFGSFHHKEHSGDHRRFPGKWKTRFHSSREDSCWDRWRYYDDFWKEEGGKAFDHYVSRRKEEKTE